MQRRGGELAVDPASRPLVMQPAPHDKKADLGSTDWPSPPISDGEEERHDITTGTQTPHVAPLLV